MNYIRVSLFLLFFILFLSCNGASITNRQGRPILRPRAISNLTCNVIFVRNQIPPFSLSDANVIAESLAYHLAQSNVFRKVGLLLQGADVTLKVSIAEADQPACGFGSFPVLLKLRYSLKGRGVNWNKIITSKTDSKLGCGDMFAAAARQANDSHLAYSKNFMYGTRALVKYLNSRQGKNQ